MADLSAVEAEAQSEWFGTKDAGKYEAAIEQRSLGALVTKCARTP